MFLPTASVVIPYYEEHLHTLKRTITSVFNRSPERLLREVILVEDGSTADHSKNIIKLNVLKHFLCNLYNRINLVY